MFENAVDGPVTAEQQAHVPGTSTDGVLGDYVLLQETGGAPMPAGFSYEEAAALPTSALTAWTATVGGGNVRRGQTVVVEGTGGVSIFEIQMAQALGAHVIVTTGSADKARRVRELGVQDVINYKETPEWSVRVLELTHGRGAVRIWSSTWAERRRSSGR
jgi:NADPH:quinone reductase-like Zn-dependent oxidoreductase